MTRNYDEFVDKFKPRHTSDDTHTPPNVYEAVLSWCERRYGIDRAKVRRPFRPGGDYERAGCPAGCVVIDNPPFSILAKIVKFYVARGIRFFLFAPGLTMLNKVRHGCTAVFADGRITYDNGASVLTGFLTNLEPPDVLAISAPDLADALAVAEAVNRKIGKRKLPKLTMPDAVLTAARMNRLAVHRVPYTVRRSEAHFVRGLDNYSGNIFGGGFLLSPRAAAERAAAERAAAEAGIKIELSPRERAIVEALGEHSRRKQSSPEVKA